MSLVKRNECQRKAQQRVVKQMIEGVIAPPSRFGTEWHGTTSTMSATNRPKIVVATLLRGGTRELQSEGYK